MSVPPCSPERFRADPLADATIARILGDWPVDAQGLARQQLRLAEVTRMFSLWPDNRSLGDPLPSDCPADIAGPLTDYLAGARHLPAWAEAAKIAQAEFAFMDHGVTACTLLFCASLPECYVVPDLAAVLHVSGQLDNHAMYRVRATAAMIFPVMMHGGLTDPSGLHAALRARGWNTAVEGLPCNQQELQYTLLTFGYVFLRGMRQLGLGLRTEQEQAFLHTWNVVGDLLGIEQALMVDTMEDAERAFARLQAEGRARPVEPDPRPGLGRALMQAMATAIPLRIAKPFPLLVTGMLCGDTVMRELGIDRQVPWPTRLLFRLGMALLRMVDAIARLFHPGFSLHRLVMRVLGYHLLTHLLMEQTWPLRMPQHLADGMGATIAQWSDDPKAPQWINALEDRLTTTGTWVKAPLLNVPG